MPANKATWLFNGGFSGNTDRVWGFSETWYSQQSGDNLVNQMNAVTDKRALIMAKDTSIVGYRIGQSVGRSFVVRKSRQAPITNESSNVPVDAALCQVKVDGASAIKRFFVHDLPDDFVEGDHIGFNFQQPILDYVSQLCFQGFQVRYQNPAADKASILSIDATGVVTTVQPFAVAVGDQVQFLAVRDTNGRAIRGKFYVSVASVGNTFTVKHWGGQTVGARGSVRKVDFRFGNALFMGPDQTIIGAASRKVGRPFFQQRGRVPARR